jgi:hypothetical protein
MRICLQEICDAWAGMGTPRSNTAQLVELLALAQQLMDEDPQNRPTASEALTSPCLVNEDMQLRAVDSQRQSRAERRLAVVQHAIATRMRAKRQRPERVVVEVPQRAARAELGRDNSVVRRSSAALTRSPRHSSSPWWTDCWRGAKDARRCLTAT